MCCHCSQYLQFCVYCIRISAIRPDIRQMNPDIRPDTGYKKARYLADRLFGTTLVLNVIIVLLSVEGEKTLKLKIKGG